MKFLDKFFDSYAFILPLVILFMFLGSWVGRTDIIESCNDLGTFTQYGVTYTCGVAE